MSRHRGGCSATGRDDDLRLRDARSMNWPRRRHVRELSDCLIYSAPDRHSRVIANCSEFVCPPNAFLRGNFAVPPEHHAGGAPNIDLGYHGLEATRVGR
jgi:hypothetical protein